MLFCAAKREEDIATAIASAEGVELRLDCFNQIDLDELKSVIKKSSVPIVLTLRKQTHGGSFAGDEKIRQELLQELFALKPHFIDLEYDTSRDFMRKMAVGYPEVKIICSYHNFENTPDLNHLLKRMYTPYCYAYKIATMANSSLDSLRMLKFIKQKTAEGIKLIGNCMGAMGTLSRILGPIFGNMITYAPFDASLPTAPGQLSVAELCNTYNFKNLGPSTSLYGLIGNPLELSLSPIAHNSVMKALGLDAVYVKVPLLKEELPEFFHFAVQNGFKGLSVTMPLKEEVLPYLTEIDPLAKKMGAVNTIKIDGDRLIGYNTDGIGAIEAIEKKLCLKDKKMIFIGAGGASKAIATIAHQKGAEIVVLNRSLPKAQDLAQQIGGRANSLENIAHEYALGYDVLINCTPEHLPVDPAYISPRALIMDIKTQPKNTSLLSHALVKGAQIVHGYEMFINQAILQDVIWFKDKAPKQTVSEIISKAVIAHVQ